jgi:hypothetical protein
VLSRGWKWIDNSPFIFTNWAKGYYLISLNQFCSLISKDLNGQWRTVECSNNLINDLKYNYICKRLSLSSTSPNVQPGVFPIQPGIDYACPNGWQNNFRTNYCYKYYNSIDDRKSFEEAKLSCKQEKADLIEIFSEEENEFVISLLRSRKYAIERQKSTIDKTKSLSCPSSWVFGPNNKCYKLILSSGESWESAQLNCTRMGASLSIINDASDNSFLAVFGK